MVNVKECYREIVGREPGKKKSLVHLMEEMLDAIERKPLSVNQQIACLFFVDLLMVRGVFKDEAFMLRAIGVLRSFVKHQGYTLESDTSVTEMLTWLVHYGN